MILTDYLINGQQLTGEHSNLIVGTTHFTSISPRINSASLLSALPPRVRVDSCGA